MRFPFQAFQPVVNFSQPILADMDGEIGVFRRFLRRPCPLERRFGGVPLMSDRSRFYAKQFEFVRKKGHEGILSRLL